MLTVSLIMMAVGALLMIGAFLRGVSAPIVDDSLKYPFFGGSILFVFGVILLIAHLIRATWGM